MLLSGYKDSVLSFKTNHHAELGQAFSFAFKLSHLKKKMRVMAACCLGGAGVTPGGEKGLGRGASTPGKAGVRGRGLSGGDSFAKPALGTPVPALVLVDSAYRHLFIIANVARER